MMLNTTEKFICKYIAAQCIVIYTYYICSQTVNYLVTTTTSAELVFKLKVYMTRNCLFPSWKDLLKLYNNFFCSY